MLDPKKLINSYIKNIELWESVIDLKEWEKNFIAGQRHACEQILESIEKNEIPAHWPQHHTLYNPSLSRS